MKTQNTAPDTAAEDYNEMKHYDVCGITPHQAESNDTGQFPFQRGEAIHRKVQGLKRAFELRQQEEDKINDGNNRYEDIAVYHYGTDRRAAYDYLPEYLK